MELELISRIERLDLGGTLGPAALSELFFDLRRSKIRRPDVVCKHGDAVLKASSSEDKWNVREQLLIANLDLGEIGAAKALYKIIHDEFPGSSRVNRLEGLILEAEGQFEKALALYNEMLGLTESKDSSNIKVNHTNVVVMKRIVACRKAAGKTEAAINDLISIITNFPGDCESWLELADLYVQFRSYEKAAHCFEEIILIDPTNSHFHNKLADLYYTLGTPAKSAQSESDLKYLLLSRKHYSISLTLQEAKINRKAIYGVQYAAKAIHEILEKGTSSKTSEAEIEQFKINKEMMDWSSEQISDKNVKI